jgi:Na+/phosphate symporter
VSALPCGLIYFLCGNFYIFHTTFNILNTLFLIGFAPLIANVATRMVRSDEDDDE